jgi:hypothetical protein
VHVREVLPPDAIPSIDDPTFGSTHVGDDEDTVIVLVADGVDADVDGGDGEGTDGNGHGDDGGGDGDDGGGDGDDGGPELAPARAYPVRILHYHEVVNDVVGGRPVAVTWCPLCGSAVVYDRRVGDRTLTFGVSGKLADDDLVLYDRETGSEWKQSLGRAIAGEHEGRTLDVLPASLTTWAEFSATYPGGVVLQPAASESEAASDTDEPAAVDYDADPYEAYVAGEGFGLAAHRGTGEGRTWDRSDLDPKTVVLGVEADGGDETPAALGFPRPRVRDAGGVVTARVGGTDVVVFAAGSELHGYANPGYSFTTDRGPEPGGTEPGPEDDGGGTVGRFVADGTTWDPVTGESADGRRLDRLPTRRLFAFTWQDDHGRDAFWSPATD